MGIFEDLNTGKYNLILFVIIFLLIFHQYFNNGTKEHMADVSSTQIADAVKKYYLADVEAIRNLSNIATQLQASGLTVPGNLNTKGQINAQGGDNTLPMIAESTGDCHIALKTRKDDNKTMYLINRDGHLRIHAHGVADLASFDHTGHHWIRHLGEGVMHMEGDGDHPYFSLGKTGTWGGKKIYIQNVNAGTDDPIFRVAVHGKRHMLDLSQNAGLVLTRKDKENTIFDYVDGRNYIRGNTNIDGTTRLGGNTEIVGNANITGELKIGNTIINENTIKRLLAQQSIAGWAVDGAQGRTLLYEGEYNLWDTSSRFDRWTNDNWDNIYVNRGWRIRVWDDYVNGAVQIVDATNKNDFIPTKHDLTVANKASGYKAEWVGY